MMANDLGDDEVQELLGKGRIKVGFFRERPQPRDLRGFTSGISWRKLVLSLQMTHPLGCLEPFSQQIDQGRVDVVDAAPN